MLQGCVPWPEELARRYIEAGVWEGITVAEMVERTAGRQPGKVAVIHGETRITYDELVQSAKRLASGLSSLGLRSQDRVVVQLPNCPEFVTLYLALNFIGVIPVMALRAHRHAEVRHFLRASGAVAYFIPDVVGTFDYRAMAAEMRPRVSRARARARGRRTGAGTDGILPLARRRSRLMTMCSGDCGPIHRTSPRCFCRAARRRCRS